MQPLNAPIVLRGNMLIWSTFPIRIPFSHVIVEIWMMIKEGRMERPVLGEHCCFVIMHWAEGWIELKSSVTHEDPWPVGCSGTSGFSGTQSACPLRLALLESFPPSVPVLGASTLLPEILQATYHELIKFMWVESQKRSSLSHWLIGFLNKWKGFVSRFSQMVKSNQSFCFFVFLKQSHIYQKQRAGYYFLLEPTKITQNRMEVFAFSIVLHQARWFF